MKVTTNRIDDFLANLKKDKAVGGVVWYDRTENPLGADSRRDAVVVKIDLVASAVCEFAGGEYLLQYGEECGKDYKDASQEFEGSARAELLLGKLLAFCKENGLDARPGVIHM